MSPSSLTSSLVSIAQKEFLGSAFLQSALHCLPLPLQGSLKQFTIILFLSRLYYWHDSNNSNLPKSGVDGNPLGAVIFFFFVIKLIRAVYPLAETASSQRLRVFIFSLLLHGVCATQTLL